MLWDFKLFHRYVSSSLQETKHAFRPKSRFLKFEARNESYMILPTVAKKDSTTKTPLKLWLWENHL